MSNIARSPAANDGQASGECHHKSQEWGMCLDLRQTPETHSPNPWGSIEHQVKNHWFNLKRWLFCCFAYTNHLYMGTNERNKYDFELNWAHLGRYFFLIKMGSLCWSIFGSCKQFISSKASHWTCVSHVKGSASACLTTVSFRDLFRLLLCELREPLSPTRLWPSATGWTLNGEGAVIWGGLMLEFVFTKIATSWERGSNTLPVTLKCVQRSRSNNNCNQFVGRRHINVGAKL